MDFNPHKPIYLQIADTLCNKVISGEWRPNDRVPSVRELGVTLGVNPNTIMRVYEHLQNLNIIFNKRGIGYFVTAHAQNEILKEQKEHFLKVEAPAFLERMKLLGVSKEEVFKDCGLDPQSPK